MKTLFFMLMSSTAFAGTWACETGIDGKIIYHITVKGDEQGHLENTAIVSVAGLPGGPLSVRPDQAAADELTRVLVGAEDPRSKTLFRIMATPLQPNVYPAHSMLVNFAIKQDFDGTCTYSP